VLDVLIHSPSPSRRDALRRVLESAEVRVIGEAEPDATGEGLPGGAVTLLDGEEAMETLRETEDEWPAAVVWLVDQPDRESFDRVRRLDASGWTMLPADAGPERLRAAILAAAAGLTAVPLEWRDELRRATPGHHAGTDGKDSQLGDFVDADEDGDVRETLTGREAEVLEWMARGLSNREIGLRLGISEHTAKFHVASVLGKLGAHNRADAVRRGVRRGLVTV